MSPLGLKVLETLSDVRRWRRSELGTIGLIPTMGSLHRGHATLLRRLRGRCDISVLSIFVNPTQFGPHEDFDRYPRSFENDLRIAADAGVDIVLAPSVQEVYPPGYTTFVDEQGLSVPLCGRFRPGHFKGVTTVVLKLFNLIRPQLALFGMKDAQQFFVLQKMVRDLNLDIQIEGVETVREPDGLALSSRNAYLTPQDRERAPQLYQTLLGARDRLQSRESTVQEILRASEEQLTQQGFNVQYLDCLKLPQLSPVENRVPQETPCLLATAAYLGKTRLIDNVILNPEKLEAQEPY